MDYKEIKTVWSEEVYRYNLKAMVGNLLIANYKCDLSMIKKTLIQIRKDYYFTCIGGVGNTIDKLLISCGEGAVTNFAVLDLALFIEQMVIIEIDKKYFEMAVEKEHSQPELLH